MVELLGREAEWGALETWLEDMTKAGGALAIRGAPGVGKSALLAAAVARARRSGHRAIDASGFRSEAAFAFAGLHQLLRPLLDGSMQGDRRFDALRAAFGSDSVAVPGTFQVAHATLDLLARAATTAPVLLAVDDAHWLDEATAGVLAFVAHRIAPMPVRLLIAGRDGAGTSSTLFRVTELWIGPLDDRSSAELVDARVPGLGLMLRNRVLEAAAGNPLALLELAPIARSHRTALFGLPEQLPVTARLEKALLDRFSGLPAPTQTLLLLSATDSQSRLNEVLAGASGPGEDAAISLEDLAPAVAAGLIEPDCMHIKFCHPLLPAAIYQASSPAKRQRAHAALATAMEVPDRQAWHRAASITHPDEEAASTLDNSARAAASRNPANVTLAALARAAELTPDTKRRGGRLLSAVELALDLGEPCRATQLLADVDLAACDELDRARIALGRDQIGAARLADGKRLDTLLDASRGASSTGEIDIALRLLHAATACAWWADAGPDVRERLVAAVKCVPAGDEDLRVRAIGERAAPQRSCGTFLETTSHLSPDSFDPVTAHLLGVALHATGVFDRAAIFLASAAAGLRHQGRRGLLAQALAQQAWTALATGNFSDGLTAAAEALSLARETGQSLWEASGHAALSMIAAIQGDEASAQSSLREAEAIALPLGARAVLADLLFVRSLIALGDGRYEEAFDHVRRSFDPNDPAHHTLSSLWRIGELAEAAAHSGHLNDARKTLASAERAGQNAASSCAQVGLLYARPLLAHDDDAAQAHFQAALNSNLATWPFYRARMLLEYGAWLRRRRRVAQARMPLRAAHEAFDALGARPWITRARQELRASREAPRLRGTESWNQLTEQEGEIASLAAQGLSNREIAERLYISARTVGSHLYHIFPKLGISSRTQLRAVLTNNGMANAIADLPT